MPGEEYTFSDLAKHTTNKDCWILVNGLVYDVTEFLDEHPGGGDLLVQVAGKDATSDFEDIGHSNHAREMLAKYKIGAMKVRGVQCSPRSDPIDELLKERWTQGRATP